MPSTYPLFISYRRSDLSLEAEWLANLVRTFFGNDSVFFDREEIVSGTRWDDTLRTCIRSARVILVLIGPNWLKAQGPSGMRRLDDPEDWVRHEVVGALEAARRSPTEVRVFPVLVNGAELPRREWLPEAIADLSSYQLEPALQFHVREYLDRAALIHGFLDRQLRQLPAGVAAIRGPSFDRERVPSPYSVAGFQLPPALRLHRPANPFKGLTHFGRDDAPVFFGRSREVGELIDTFKKGHHVVRLFGQSGIGKSSFLFAGLLPFLEGNGWDVHYVRWNAIEPPELSVHSDSDALIVLDQLDEILTNSDRAPRDELERLARATGALIRSNANRERPIRVIWAYRKEYDVNMKTALQDQRVYSTEYWLKDLDRDGMREAITGITRDRDLQTEYRLEMEPGLDQAILADLLGNRQRENATPLLQVLLRRMWDRVKRETGQRTFTRDLYESCRSGDLGQLLHTQLDAVASRSADLRRSVESGLALDVLRRLVTEQDTSLTSAEDELLGRYAPEAPIRSLLQQLVDHYLIVREDGPRYRLSHDTLARVVRVQHASSVLPGQRATRLLDSKAHDMETAPQSVDFSRADLLTIDEGLTGMRRLTDSERQVIDASRARRSREEQDLEEINANLRQALEGERQQALIARSNFLNLEASQQADLTTATRLSLEAVRLFSSAPALATLYRCFDAAYAAEVSRPLRHTVARDGGHVSVMAGETGIVYAERGADGALVRYDFENGATRRLPHRGAEVAFIRCSPFAPLAFVSRSDKTAAIVNLENDAVTPLPAPIDFDEALFVDRETLFFHHRSRLSSFLLASGTVNVVLDMPAEELISTFAVTAEGRVVLASRLKSLYIYSPDTAALQRVWEHTQIISTARAIAPSQVLLGDSRRRVMLLDLSQNSLTTIQEANNNESIQGTFLADGRDGTLAYTLTQDEDTIRVQRGDEVFHLRCESGDYFNGLALAPARNLAVTSGFRGVMRWRLHQTRTTVLAGTPDEGFILADALANRYIRGRTGELMRLDAESGVTLTVRQDGLVPKDLTTALAGDLVACLIDATTCLLIDLGSRTSESLQLPDAEVSRVFVGAGAVWFTVKDGGLLVYRLESRSWEQHAFGRFIGAIAFGPDGMAVGLHDGSIVIVNPANPAERYASFRKLSKALRCLAWSPDGQRLFAGGFNSFGVLCHRDGTNAQKLPHTHWIADAAFSPDGEFVATTCQDGLVRVFRVSDGGLLRSIAISGEPDTCRFTPDGAHLLISRNADRAVLRWTLFSASEIETLLNDWAIDALPSSADAPAVPAAAESDGDPNVPFHEERPPQFNLGAISITPHST